MLLHCPKCQTAYEDPHYVVPLYDMSRAADMVPMSYRAIKDYLHKHKADFPPRYRKYREKGMQRAVRLLTGKEINAIRRAYISSNRYSTKRTLSTVAY